MKIRAAVVTLKVFGAPYLGVLLLSSSSLGQVATINWTKTNFEAGVKYTEQDKVAEVSLNCSGNGAAADWYGSEVQWSQPNGNFEAVRNDAVHKVVPYNHANRDVVFNGKASVFAAAAGSSHSFDKSLAGSSVNAILRMRIHCLDYNNAYQDFPAPQALKIFIRKPVNCVRVDGGTSQGGTARGEVTVVLDDQAPASNTRVDLRWSGPGSVNLESPPSTIDVSAGQGSVAFPIIVRASTGGGKTITVTAQTLGIPQTAQFMVNSNGVQSANPQCADK